MRDHHSLILLVALAGCHHHSTGGGEPDLGPGGADFAIAPLPTYDLACVGSTIAAHLVPVSLVVMLDASGSMGDGLNGDPALKWQPVTQGLQAFFEDGASTGVSASLQYFPLPNSNDICNLSGYYTPAVSMRTLPDLSFGLSMAATTPKGSTPTLPTMQGASMYAQDTQSTDPSQKVAMVLVTDGEPDSCSSSLNNVSLELAKAEKLHIPTYVIGVGTDLTSLDQLATAGGTTSPTLVAVGDPTTTKTQFLAALDAIRGLVLSCDFPIPPAPAGMTIDYTQVNVTFTPSVTMTPELVPYDKDCSTGMPGWRYDDPNNPTQVQLCAPSCDAARADRAGAINLLFGCTTVGNLIS